MMVKTNPKELGLYEQEPLGSSTKNAYKHQFLTQPVNIHFNKKSEEF